MRVAGIVGNTLLVSGLGTAAFFGYYTAKYTPDEVAAMVDAKATSESAPDQVKASDSIMISSCRQD